MSDRFLDQYDEARSMLREAIWEKYARDQRGAILRGLRAIDILRADVELGAVGGAPGGDAKCPPTDGQAAVH
jgi:hypothetical protein